MATETGWLEADSSRLGERVKNVGFRYLLLAAALLGVVSLLILLVYVTLDALALLKPTDAWLDLGLLTGTYATTPEDAGIYPQIVGSLFIMLVMVLGVFPIGVGAAVYLEEFAPDNRWTRLVQINIGNLAGVPSVVYGILGLAVFINAMGFGRGVVLVAAFTLGLLVLPIVIVSSQEALRSVPDSRRQASYGMGASRCQTVRHVVLPEAMPGILTGTILALSRAIGETAPLLVVGLATTVFSVPTGLLDKAAALPLQIYAWVSFPQPEFRYGVVAASVVVLLVMMLSLNAAAILIRNTYQRRN
ncbi:MAG: phosphate ABC transporter permease PstA [Halobacteriales archaeon]